jgi:branched-chain amino acid transport system substrate-binding protein
MSKRVSKSGSISRRRLLATAGAGAALAASPLGANLLRAQEGPIKIGMSMPQTGGLAGGGKPSLLGIEIWRDDVNAKGGLLGRKVELVVYDDKSSASETPAIYSKLIDVDKVDLLFAPYATVPTAPIMPLVKQRGLLLMGNFSFQVNSKVHHDMWFNNAPWGPADSWATGFLTLGQKAGGKTMALLAADQEFAQNLAKTAREVAAKLNIPIVYDQAYPPSTAEFSSIIRALTAAKPDIVFVASYPGGSIGMVRAVNEIGYTPKMFGGAMIGLQLTPIKAQLGPLLNGLVINENYVPEPTMKFAGVDDFLRRYQERAKGAGVDPLGLWSPFAYAEMQILGQAVQAVGAIDQARLADYLHKTTFKTIVGDVKFSASGEWEKTRILTVQYRKVRGNDISQFREPGKAVIVHPSELKSGELVYPFAEARGH